MGKGFDLPVEIESMSDLDIDVMGMSETNKPWTSENKHEYDMLMRSRFRQSRTIYSSAAAPRNTRYQPGGNLLTINGHTTGRISARGSDDLGRFCWFALRGRRDEGVLVISAYRVCHEAHDAPGPFTAYQQQYTALRARGVAAPNPRRQLLADILTLIRTYRATGFRPILMMDANGDYRSLKDPDKDLAQFLHDASLSDPFYSKFHSSPKTTAYGTKRIDYIFIDPALNPALTRIGYLGSHEGAFTDHSLAYADFDEVLLFQGVINRPVTRHSREILIEQADKVKAFLEEVSPKLTGHTIPAWTTALADKFARQGVTPANLLAYHQLYKEFLDTAKAAARKVGRKKFGYMRSGPLTMKGRMLLLFKNMLDCKRRRAQLTPKLVRQCAALGVEQQVFHSSSLKDLRVLVRQHHEELWECQKNGESLRHEWLQGIAKDRARAAGDADWEPKLRNMIRSAKENAVNRKLSIITKGPRGVLDRIQIPSHDWFHSQRHAELYHYANGVFEAYPSDGEGSFYPHHTLKVLPSDAVAVTIGQRDTSLHYFIADRLPIAPIVWNDVTSQAEIEMLLLERNKRHLQQTAREEGVSTKPFLTFIRRDHGINVEARKILDGTLTEYELTPDMAEFFNTLRKGQTEQDLPRVIGSISASELQEMFKRSKEKTSSDSRTLNYTIWKCMA